MTGRIPQFEFTQLFRSLYAGRAPLVSADVTRLIEAGITQVLDLRQSKEWSPPYIGQEALDALDREGVVRWNVGIRDLSAPSMDDLTRCWRLMKLCLANRSNRLYVCCRGGKERTAAVVIAYVARLNSIDFEQSARIVTTTRPVFKPLVHQKRAVVCWLSRSKDRGSERST